MQINEKFRARINLYMTFFFVVVSGQTGSGKTFTMMGKWMRKLNLSVVS